MTKPKDPSARTGPQKRLVPDLPLEESEDAFRRFLEETELDDDDEKDIERRIATLSGEGAVVDDDEP